MTREDIYRTLKLSGHSDLSGAINRAGEVMDSIKAKFVDGRLWHGIEFNLEETKEIYRQLNRSELELIMLEENWKDKPSTDIYTLKGTQDFIEAFEKDNKIKCCNTCKYLKGRSYKDSVPHPWCSLYKKYLISFNAKVYEDWCSSYTYIELSRPRQWYKNNAPCNLNNYGETDTVNGIKNSELQGQRKSDEPIIHVGQIGF